jgi:hypothetical protein
VVLCKTCETITGGSGYVLIFLFLGFVKLKDGVRNIRLCNLSGLRDSYYQM